MAIQGTGYTVSAAGRSPAIAVTVPLHGQMLPGVLACMSTGASLTYNVEVTGDNTNATGWSVASANWVPLSDMTGLTASKATTLVGLCTAICVNVTAYTSGTLNFNVVQLQG